MGRPDPRFLVVGHLNKPHGTKGEFVVWTLTDHPGGIYAPGVVLHLGSGEGHDPDPDLPRLEIEGARPFRQGYIVSFVGVESRTEADVLRGRYLYREAEALEPLAEGEVFYHQLLGMRVETASGEPLGVVREVYEMSPADMLDIEREDGRTTLIPFLDHVVKSVDVAANLLVVEPPEGLLDL